MEFSKLKSYRDLEEYKESKKEMKVRMAKTKSHEMPLVSKIKEKSKAFDTYTNNKGVTWETHSRTKGGNLWKSQMKMLNEYFTLVLTNWRY